MVSGETFTKKMQKRQIDLDVSNKELREVVGWSYQTHKRRLEKPDSITLGEAWKISNYLNF